MKKLTSLALGLTLAQFSFANTITETLDSLKASPFDMTLEMLTESAGTNQANDNSRINSNLTYFYAYAGYSIDANNHLRLTPEVTTQLTAESDYENRNWDLASIELRYKRSNILTEAQNGANLSAEIRIAPLTDVGPTDVVSNLRATLSKAITNKFSLSAQGRAYVYSNKSGLDSAAGLTRNKYRLYISPTYAVSDSVSFTIYNRFEHKNLTAGETAQSLLIEPSVDIALGSGFNAYAYVDYYAARSDDGEGLRKFRLNESLIGAGLVYSLF